MQQYEYQKHNPGTPVTLKHPREPFKPSAEISTDDAVALSSSSYQNYKATFAIAHSVPKRPVRPSLGPDGTDDST